MDRDRATERRNQASKVCGKKKVKFDPFSLVDFIPRSIFDRRMNGSGFDPSEANPEILDFLR